MSYNTWDSKLINDIKNALEEIQNDIEEIIKNAQTPCDHS